MQIMISSEYRVTGSELQWTLERAQAATSSGAQRRTTPITKNTGWRALGYFPSLQMAVTCLHEYRVRICDATTLAAALAESKRIEREIMAALSPEFEVTKRRVAE